MSIVSEYYVLAQYLAALPEGKEADANWTGFLFTYEINLVQGR